MRYAMERHRHDPLIEKVALKTRGMSTMTTAHLFDLIGFPNTTSNERRICKIMRGRGFIAVEFPNGWSDTVSRGWARPVRDMARQQGASIPASNDPSAKPERITAWDEEEVPSSDYVTVWIDVWKLDALLPLASNMEHVGFAGENGIFGKYDGFDEFVRRSRQRIVMPWVKVERACKEHPDQDIAYISNGRHRFAWMRDHGAQALPVSALRSEANEVAQLVGTSARECRVAMDRIPEW